MVSLFDCVDDDLRSQCGELVTALFRKSIEVFGCMNGSLENQITLQQLNTTGMLTDKYRRDYFKEKHHVESELLLSKSVGSLEEIVTAVADPNSAASTQLEDVELTNDSWDDQIPTESQQITRDAIESTTASADMKKNQVEKDDNRNHNLNHKEAVSEPTTHSATVTSSSHSSHCTSYRDHRIINFCHRNIMAKLSAISTESPSSSSVRFPLYNVSFNDVVTLCDDLREAGKCMNGVDELCQHPLLDFLGQQFSATCELLEMKDFGIDYKCTQEKLTERNDCTALLNMTIDSNEDKCREHEGFLSCIKAELEEVCGLESYNSVVLVLRGYGCNISDDIVARSTFTSEDARTSSLQLTIGPAQVMSSSIAIETSHISATSQNDFKVDDVEEEGSGEESMMMTNVVQVMEDTAAQNSEQLVHGTSESTDIIMNLSPSSLTEVDSEETRSSYSSVKVPYFFEDNEAVDDADSDDPLFNYTISKNCTVAMRNEEKMCLKPLMRTWMALREVWPHLAQVTFPVYKYSRVDLLELCDSYANVLLCSNPDHLQVCDMDELVRFAKDHLGYICMPQNIQRFMKHYDCIMEQEAMGRGNCQQHIMGEAIPGKDEHKCHGVKSYRQCLAPYVKMHCQPEALQEFDASIRHFGCYADHQL